MKTFYLLAMCLFVATATVRAEDQPQLVKIRTVDGQSVWVTKKVLQETYFETFGAPKPQLSAFEKAKELLKVRQDSYQWAYSGDGMNVTASVAAAFSEDMASREKPAEAFAAYKAAFTFAYSGDGANLSKEPSRQLAEKFSRIDSPLETLELFKSAFKTAYSGDGMNMTSQAAIAYALKAVGLK
jgi:hypothetical protein